MSYVADVILTMSLLEETGRDDRCMAVEAINVWLEEQGKGELKQVDDFAGGRKSIQAMVFMGAFNYLCIPEFVAAVGAAPWQDEERVQLFIKNEEENIFTDMTPKIIYKPEHHPAAGIKVGINIHKKGS